MRIAALDLGTNTFLMLVVEYDGETLRPLHRESEVVRLGRGLDASGYLTPASMEKGLQCLEAFVRQAKELGADPILACGTSALREAKNADVFLHRARERTGLNIRVISGEQEAEYSFFGALSNKPDLPEPIVLVDIGGGSTELCGGTHRKMEKMLSVKIGSVRLTERFLRHDPVLPEEMDAVTEAIDRHLDRLPVLFPYQPPFSLIGNAGTVTTLAAMSLRLHRYDADKVDGCRLSLEGIETLIGELARRTVEERKKMVGLPEKRADVILAGAVILSRVMRKLRQPELIVSDRGIRFGMILDYLRRMQ